ncbi:MAG: shikimate kinase [Bacteroidota bacterium]
MKIYLIGYMGSGKSRFGRKLAHRLGYDFIDLDDLFEERFKISILDFFNKYNENDFRKMENELLEETFQLDRTVVSTGGGTPCFFDNMQKIRQHGTSIYLKLPPEMLIARLKTVKKKRPLLQKKSPVEMELFVKEQLKQREHFYMQADFTIDVPNLNFPSVVALLEPLMH